MTAELWLMRPCEEHGEVEPHRVGFMPVKEYGEWELGEKCLGGSRVRLDPDQTLLFIPDPARMGETIVYLDVKDVIDALEEPYEPA